MPANGCIVHRGNLQAREREWATKGCAEEAGSVAAYSCVWCAHMGLHAELPAGDTDTWGLELSDLAASAEMQRLAGEDKQWHKGLTMRPVKWKLM